MNPLPSSSAKSSATPSSLVTIAMTSYNNASYLEQAVVGCLAQKTTFPFEVLIADDASTDGSRELIQKLATKHKNIRVLQQNKNCIEKNYTDMLNKVRSKYIAFCDGDDFWIDEDKLEMQIRYLEEHPEFAVCAHKTDVLLEGYSGPEHPKPIFKRNASKRTQETGVLFADEIADNYYLHTSSYVFRWLFPQGLPPYWQNFMTNDHFLLLLHASEGKIKYFDRTMSVWRRHDNGYTWLQTRKPSAYIREKWDQYIELQIRMDRFFEGRFHYQLLERVRFALHGIVSECLAAGDTGMLDLVVARYPGYFWEIEQKYEKLLDGYRVARPLIRPTAFHVRHEQADAPTAGNPIATAQTVGGAVPLDMESIPQAEGSVWRHWLEGQEHICFHNTVSALGALLRQEAVRRLWFPTFGERRLQYCSNALGEILLIWYDVSDRATYHPAFLDLLQPGDAVLAPCFFGAPLPDFLFQAVADHPDIVWIEDRSFALEPGYGEESPFPWKLYSPCSILGVPDGGILVGAGLDAWTPLPAPIEEELMRDRLAPVFLNLEFPDRGFLRAGTPQDDTLATDYSKESMSRLTRLMLERMPLRPIAEARKRNWRTLFNRLSHLALWDVPSPAFSPSAFPLMLPENRAASRLMNFLRDEGIQCPVPYSVASQRLRSEALFTRFCALPCDHQYSEADMERVAEAVVRLEKVLW